MTEWARPRADYCSGMRRSFVVVVLAVVVAGLVSACPADSAVAEGEGEGKSEGEGEGEVDFDGVPLRFVIDGVEVGIGESVDFGSVDSGNNVERELTLEAVEAALVVTVLSEPPVLLGGRDVDMWSVVTQPAATVTSSGSPVRVRFAPTVGGVLQGKLVVAWGRATDERLIVDVSGTGVGPAAPGREPGLRTAIYDGSFELLPDFDTLTPTTTFVSATVSIVDRVGTDLFAYRFQGAVDVPAAGAWTFVTESDDGSRLLIDGAVVVDNNRLQAPTEVAGVVELTAGLHAFEVQFFENGGGELLNVSWEGPDVARAPIPAAALFTSP